MNIYRADDLIEDVQVYMKADVESIIEGLRSALRFLIHDHERGLASSEDTWKYAALQLRRDE